MPNFKSSTQNTPATTAAVRASFLNNPIKDIERNAAQFLLWSVFQKFISRKDSIAKNKKDNQLTKTLCTDVALVCFELASTFTSLTAAEANRLQSQKCFSKEDILKAIRSVNRNVYEPKHGYYDDLRNDIYGYSAYTTGQIHTDFPRIQLEALCIYAFEKSYDEFIVEKHRLYKGDGKIQFIKANLSEHFGGFICELLTAIENFNHGDSPSVIKNVLEILSEETDTIISALNESKIVRPPDKYLNTLHYFMDKATAGFGVNIKEFNEVWKEDIGKKILAINKQQIQGRTTSEGKKISHFPYRRIFLMDADNITKIFEQTTDENTAELEALKIQLDHDVLVYCIFRDDWKTSAGKNHYQFDYAILKVDNCPMLIGTKFDKTNHAGLENGIFFTDTQKAKIHFNNTLGRLLEIKDTKVYKPSWNSKSKNIDFKEPIKEWEKIALINDLKAAAECK